jgi:hypothetical protein
MSGCAIRFLLLSLFVNLNEPVFSQNTTPQDFCYDMYIMPRWTESGCFYIPRFNFEMKSEKEKYIFRSYFTTSLNDSVYELFYEPICFEDDVFSNLIKLKDTTPTRDPKIVFITSNNQRILVDKYKRIYIDAAVYKMPKSLWEILNERMPCELAENWLINYNTDGMDDTYLRKLFNIE